jgi:hypothetical protein
MTIRILEGARDTFRRKSLIAFLRALLVCVSASGLFLAGCASPGEPYERKTPVPAPVKDLAAEQAGNDVVLFFSLPDETVDHRPLRHLPAVEIYRAFEPAPSNGDSLPVSASAQPPSLLITIPAAMVPNFSDHGHIRYTDSLGAADFSQNSGQIAHYLVRTRASEKKSSLDSNGVVLRFYPVPLPITDVTAQVTHNAVELTWTPPQRTPVGPAGGVSGYAIYRAPVERGAVEANTSAPNSENPKLQSPLVRIGESTSPNYRDTETNFGNTYAYSVRSLSETPGKTLESSNSNLVVVVDRDTFPPAAPLGLVVAPVPARPGAPVSIDLSWAISPETDVAGYNVYRTDRSGLLGNRQNAELLPTPAFRDMNIAPGRTYFYAVTAVDRSGNESIASQPVSAVVPVEAPSQP